MTRAVAKWQHDDRRQRAQYSKAISEWYHIEITFTDACTHDIHTHAIYSAYSSVGMLPITLIHTCMHANTYNCWTIKIGFITYANIVVDSYVLGFTNFTPLHLFLHSLQLISIPNRSSFHLLFVSARCVRRVPRFSFAFALSNRKYFENHFCLKCLSRAVYDRHAHYYCIHWNCLWNWHFFLFDQFNGQPSPPSPPFQIAICKLTISIPLKIMTNHICIDQSGYGTFFRHVVPIPVCSLELIGIKERHPSIYSWKVNNLCPFLWNMQYAYI